MPMGENKKVNVLCQTKAMKAYVTKNDFPNYVKIIIILHYVNLSIQLYYQVKLIIHYQTLQIKLAM